MMYMPDWSLRSQTPGRLRLRHPFLETEDDFRRHISEAIRRVSRAIEIRIGRPTASLLLRYDPRAVQDEQLFSAIISASESWIPPEGDTELRKIPFATLATYGQLGLSSVAFLVTVGAIAVPSLQTAALVTTALAAGSIVGRAGKALLIDNRIKVDLLDATVISGAILYGYLPFAAAMIWTVDFSQILLANSRASAHARLRDVFGYSARFAWRLQDGVEIEYPVEALEQGDVVVVRAGGVVPVDGEILSGDALIDQAALTGESVPIERGRGDSVLAMGAVIAGEIQVRASRTARDTTAARMIEIIEDAVEHRVSMQTFSEKFADGMVVPTLALGAIASQTAGKTGMLAVINADFDTGIRFAGPIAILSSLSAAARNGILIKSGPALEAIGRTNCMVFDKTGTLTVEIPQVAEIFTLDARYSATDLLRMAATAERKFQHPIAHAILREARERQIDVPVSQDTSYDVGLGVKVTLDGQEVAVGSARYLDREGVDAGASAALQDPGGGRSRVLVAVDQKTVGYIELESAVRPEVSRLIRSLQEHWGIDELYMISGDAEAATASVANKLGIEHYRSGMSPSDKADFVRDLQARDMKVMMVGDGINDSAALAVADCSVSLAGASDAATDFANVVFLDGDLAKFEQLFQISDNLMSNVRTNLYLVGVPNTVLIAGAMAGVFGLAWSYVLNNAFNLVVAANGFRAQNSLQPIWQDTALIEHQPNL